MSKSQSEYNRQYYAKHRDKLRERRIVRYYHIEHARKQRQTTKLSLRDRQLLKYGVSEERYNYMLKLQNGLCAICRQPANGRKLSVDHNHETGAVRGLLCTGCNATVGYIENGKWAKILAYLNSF